MHLVSPELEAYIDRHTSAETELMAELNRRTHADVLMPQMLSGKVQGRVLQMFSHMLRPRRVLEIGTFTGYSALCLAAGLPEDGKLYTIDINEELEDLVRGYIARAGLQDQVEYVIGDATKIIPELNETFDLVFIDADKVNYGNYYDLVIGKVRSGGFILADNVLWSGKVIDEKKDKDTQAICDFNDKVQQDPRVDHVIMSVRDGILVIRKK